jgi:anthraniloyl-CoA monooxygenase
MISKDYLEKLFADQIDGHRLLVNNSRWANFRTRRTRRWHSLSPRPVALLGDAVHTAHFSVGSGTKMAMEDAMALSQALARYPGDLGAALTAYEQAAQPPVQKIQNSARPSLAWWEHFGRYYDAFEPWQFAYHFLSRSINDAQLARRAPDFVDASHRAWIKAHGSEPLQTSFANAGWTSPGRVVEVQAGPSGPAAAATAHSPGLPLADEAPADGPWGARLAAPDREAGLPAVFGALSQLTRHRPAVVAVHGGTPLTRTLVCEQARLQTGVPALLIDDGLDADLAVTMVLSGRADLVGASADLLRTRGLLA